MGPRAPKTRAPCCGKGEATEELLSTHPRRDTPTSRPQAPCANRRGQSPNPSFQNLDPDWVAPTSFPGRALPGACLSPQHWSLKATSCFPFSLCSGQALPWPAMPSPSRDAPHSSSQDHQCWFPLLRCNSEAALWGSGAASEHAHNAQPDWALAGWHTGLPHPAQAQNSLPRFLRPGEKIQAPLRLPPSRLQPSLTQLRLPSG